MAKGISSLGDPKVAENLGKSAEGVIKLMGAFTGEGFFGTMKGLGNMAALTTTMASMAIAGTQMEGIERTFTSIAAVMNGDPSQLDKIKNTIQSISEIDTANDSALSTLTKLLSQPLTVKFADEKVAINVDTTLQLDGDTLYRKVIKQYSTITRDNDARNGNDTVKNT
jgi:hypothetical protein